LRKFLEPAHADYCPTNEDSKIEITESDSAVETKFNFAGVLPNEDAKDWHCKWQVKLDSSLSPAGIDEDLSEREGNGWIVIEATSAGFDSDVFIHMQPPGKFYDYNFRSESTDPTTQTFVGKHRQG
jgi:hypothetical protein